MKFLTRLFRRRKQSPPDRTPCPHCGAMILETAIFCRHCGASESSGWDVEESEHYAESFDDDFNYDEFIQNEFPDASPRSKITWRTIVTVIVLLGFVIAMLMSY